jgi:hypothetical protein
MEEIHHGISLKVTDSSNKHVPVSNLGEKSFHGAKEVLQSHREHILRKFPKLKHATNAETRKAMMKSDSKMNDYIREKNKKTLEQAAKKYHEHISKLPKHELVHHIKQILHSHATPMQEHGHNHIRHTTYTKSNGEYGHHSITPNAHHEHIYNTPHHIEVHHSGTSVHFKHKGKTFGRVELKFTSQSDPLSSIKGSGQTSGD